VEHARHRQGDLGAAGPVVVQRHPQLPALGVRLDQAGVRAGSPGDPGAGCAGGCGGGALRRGAEQQAGGHDAGREDDDEQPFDVHVASPGGTSVGGGSRLPALGAVKQRLPEPG
jgi:hypothetical protein